MEILENNIAPICLDRKDKMRLPAQAQCQSQKTNKRSKESSCTSTILTAPLGTQRKQCSKSSKSSQPPTGYPANNQHRLKNQAKRAKVYHQIWYAEDITNLCLVQTSNPSVDFLMLFQEYEGCNGVRTQSNETWDPASEHPA